MSDFTPKITAFCCHYTSQQTLAEGKEGMRADGFPDCVTINRLTCSGKLQEFEEGADAVYVVGCHPDKCHNVKGSQRAAKRVGAVKKALEELGVEPERIAMYHMSRGFHPEFVTAAQEMEKMVKQLGASPFKGESK